GTKALSGLPFGQGPCSLHSGSNGAGCPLLIAKIWPAVVIIGAVDLPKLAETTRTLVGTPALFFSTIPTPFPIMTGRLIIACCSILLARDTFCLCTSFAY